MGQDDDQDVILPQHRGKMTCIYHFNFLNFIKILQVQLHMKSECMPYYAVWYNIAIRHNGIPSVFYESRYNDTMCVILPEVPLHYRQTTTDKRNNVA